MGHLTNTQLAPLEHKDVRVLTTKQLAEFYGVEERRISETFNRNADKFEEGKHYFALQADEKKEFINRTQIAYSSIKAEKFYLWTEKGAARHAKVLNTEKAWQVFEELEEVYFRVKAAAQQPAEFELPRTFSEALRKLADTVEANERLERELAKAQPKVAFFDAVADSKTAIEIGTVAKILAIPGVGRNNLFDFLRERSILQANNVPYQKYVDYGYFRVVEQHYVKPNGENCVSIKTLVYQRGLDFIRRLLDERYGVVPGTPQMLAF